MAAGNTDGSGATPEYIRARLDASGLDRFFSVKIGYCREIVDKVADGCEYLGAFIWALMEANENTGAGLIVSYRAAQRLAHCERVGLVDDVALTASVFRGTSAAVRRNLKANITDENAKRSPWYEIM